MSAATLDAGVVAQRLREIAEAELLGRFRKLAAHEIREKGPGNLVTVADEAAEARLEAALTDLLPGSRVVGEEAAALDSTVFRHLRQEEDPVWIVDPVDGTGNFARGDDRFASMVALVERGRILKGWIYRPIGDVMAVAEMGGGAVIDGRPARVGGSGPLGQVTACFSMHRRPFDLRPVAKSLRTRVGRTVDMKCIGLHYLMLAEGRIQLGFFNRLMPWDHAAGVLLLTEAGGTAAHLDRRPYDLDPGRAGLLAAADDALWREAHAVVTADPDLAALIREEARVAAGGGPSPHGAERNAGTSADAAPGLR